MLRVPRVRGRMLALLFCLVAVVSFILGVCMTVAVLDPERSVRPLPLRSRAAPPPDGLLYPLVVLVLSSPSNTERRATMRATWLRRRAETVRHWFVMGTADMDPTQLAQLNTENRLHKDLLLLPGVTDSYARLTDKVLAAFTWMSQNVRFKYLLKCDDDTFARVGELLDVLNTSPETRLYMGFFDGRARPKASGVWKEQNWDLCDTYLPYALGGGYIVSSDLVAYMADSAAFLRRFNSEDVSVGAWLGPLDVTRRHDTRFDTEYMSRGCDNRYLVTHKQDIGHMEEKQRTLERRGVLCERESRVRKSYIYDWNVPPSKCCQRTADTQIP